MKRLTLALIFCLLASPVWAMFYSGSTPVITTPGATLNIVSGAAFVYSTLRYPGWVMCVRQCRKIT